MWNACLDIDICERRAELFQCLSLSPAGERASKSECLLGVQLEDFLSPGSTQTEAIHGSFY